MIKKSEQTDRLIGRIYNWKFDQALERLNQLPTDAVEAKDRHTIRELAAMYSDCGWFGGTVGESISKTVADLIGEEPE